MPGTATRALALTAEAGVSMTGAGATYPYGIDPQDSNIRIAPTFPSEEELKKAVDVFCTCLKLAVLEKLIGYRSGSLLPSGRDGIYDIA